MLCQKNECLIIEINVQKSEFTDTITDIFLEGKATEIMNVAACSAGNFLPILSSDAQKQLDELLSNVPAFDKASFGMKQRLEKTGSNAEFLLTLDLRG